jgi:hypothetical protein
MKTKNMVLIHSNGGWIWWASLDGKDQKYINNLGAKMGRALAKNGNGCIKILNDDQLDRLKCHYEICKARREKAVKITPQPTINN